MYIYRGWYEQAGATPQQTANQINKIDSDSDVVSSVLMCFSIIESHKIVK
jgi:hypothetical protein